MSGNRSWDGPKKPKPKGERNVVMQTQQDLLENLGTRYGLTQEETLDAVLRAANKVASRHKCKISRRTDEIIFVSAASERIPARVYWSELTAEVDAYMRKTAKRRAMQWPAGVHRVRVASVEREFIVVESLDGALYGVIPQRLRSALHVAPGDQILVASEGGRKLNQTSEEILRHVMQREIPEVADGTVEIVRIGRLPGLRSKVAVRSNDSNVNAVGACLGQHASRIAAVRSALGGEGVDVIPYHDKMSRQIAAAFAPVQIADVKMHNGTAHVYVAPSDLTRAIGKHGDNAKLAALLTGQKIDVRATQRAAS